MAYSYDFTPTARQLVIGTQAYLAEPVFGDDAQARFVRALQEAVDYICDENKPRQVLDETGSLAFSMPVYMRLFSTAKTRKRRSSSSAWRLYYTMRDYDGDGQADTVLILHVSHAAAEPLTSWLGAPSNEGDADE